MRILIAEDDEALAKFVRQGLEGEGHTVDVLTDGEQARLAATDSEYDVVILDLNLPKLDGVSVLRHLRLKKPSLPILILTQRNRVEDRVQCLDTGADDYVRYTETLHVAFGEGIDYHALYALERMLGCHTQPCLAVPSLVRRYFSTLPGRHVQGEIVFDRLGDVSELARVVRSYAGRLNTSEVRLVRCGPHLWVRLLDNARPLLDLVVKSLCESVLPLSSLRQSPALAV